MAEKRQNFSTGSHFEEAYSYSRAVRVGDMVFVSGTVGLDYETRTIPEDPVEQFHQAIANITRALEMAGARVSDIVQLMVFVTDADVMEAIGPAIGETFRDVRPTNTTVTVDFPFPGIKLELQVTGTPAHPPYTRPCFE